MSLYLKKKIEEGEHQQQDFKFCITDSKKIARSLAAFSNTDGGRLLIGVKDNGAIAGVRTEEEFYMIEAAAQMYCKPSIDFESKTHNVEGKVVLEITVKKQEDKLISAPTENGDWKIYLRVADQNLLANFVFIKAWHKKQEGKPIFIEYTDKEKEILKFLSSKNKASLSAICRAAQISRKQAQNILIDFIVLDLIRINFTEKQVFYELIEEN